MKNIEIAGMRVVIFAEIQMIKHNQKITNSFLSCDLSIKDNSYTGIKGVCSRTFEINEQ
jgi:hypothetical protein